MYNYDCLFWIGLVYLIECYFLIWKVEEDYFIVKVLVNVYEGLFGKVLVVDKWIFLINGVFIMGCYGILVIGFGLGKEFEVYVFNEKIWKFYLVICVVMYVVILLSWLVIE